MIKALSTRFSGTLFVFNLKEISLRLVYLPCVSVNLFWGKLRLGFAVAVSDEKKKQEEPE